METVGTISNIQMTFPERKTIVTLEVESAPAEVERLRNRKLTVGLKQYRQKRSTDSNAYYWLLVGKIATHDHIGRIEIHNRLLKEYGQELIEDGAMRWALMPQDFQWERSTEGHYKPAGTQVKTEKGRVLDLYWIVRGSHTYNTEEMSALIDGAIDMCKERHIETMTPDELQHLFAMEEGHASHAEH